MADDIDRANDLAQVILDNAIAAQRSKANVPRASVAECLNECGEPPLTGGFFCSADCRRDYEYRQQVRQRQGLA